MGTKLVGVLAALSVGGSIAWAASTKPLQADQGQGQGSAGKVTICHHTGSGDSQTITVSANAVPAHLAHGDTVGACEGYGYGG